MSVIKGINKISGYILPEELIRLEAGAALHQRHSNITFKIINCNGISLDIRTEQGKCAAGNYADQATLITRTRELFGKFFPDLIIHVHPVTYKAAGIDMVTPQWINNQMRVYGITIKDFVRETGIDRTNISAWINGLRPMSQIVKALLFQTVKLYAVKDLVKVLSKLQPNAGLNLRFPNYFDKELIELLAHSNVNSSKFDITTVENETEFSILIVDKKYA